MILVLREREALVTETTFRIKLSLLEITVSVAMSEKLNELAAIRSERLNTIIWKMLFILWSKRLEYLVMSLWRK